MQFEKPETSLPDSGALTRVLLENSPDSLGLLDANGRLLLINETCRTLLAVGNLSAACGKEWRILWPESARSQVDIAMATAKAEGKGRFRGWCPTAKGEPRFWDVIVTRLPDSGGTAGFLTISRDITDIKRMEDALRRSARSTALTSEAAAELLRSDNPELIVEDICRKAMADLDCQFFFFFLIDGPMGSLSLNAFAGVPEQEARKFEQLDYGKVLSGGVVHNCESASARAARDLCAELRESHGVSAYCCHPLVAQGRVIGALAFGSRTRSEFNDSEVEVMDTLSQLVSMAISRAQMERALRASEKRFRALETATSEVVYSMSPDWSEMRRLYGRGFLEDTETQTCNWLEKYVLAEDQSRVTCAVAEAIKTKSIFELEHRVRRADGSVGWTFSRAVPISNEQGDIVEWFGAARNITGRKRAEEAFREADRRKDEFLATLAHELRNPLAPLHNGVQCLRRASMGNACDHDCAVIDMMERQVSQLIRLVDELLEVSRISRGKIELRKEQSDMAAILRNALETSQPLIEKNGHEATLSISPDALPVHGDPMRLAQVFTNLINNAAKYTPPGGRITVDASRQGQEAVVEVRDNGFGITAEDLPRVFDLFGQAGSGQEGGLGIGLALARNLVEMHGGKIDARSDGPGNGSVFIVRLPLDHSPPLEYPKNVGPPAPTDYARRVLVIDDDHDVANSLGMLLESLGAEVLVVYDGQSGVEILAAFDPDIVFIDIGMPKVDGWETARRVRACSNGREFNLVALTGWGQADDRARSFAAGFDAHITKPASVEMLERLLRRSDGSANVC